MTTGSEIQLHRRTARFAGLAYLATAITGVLSFFVIRPRLMVAGDGSATMVRLIDNESLARVGLVVDLALITSGIVTALLFYALFRKVDAAASMALAAFALMGGLAITIGTICSAKALDVALGGVDGFENPSSLVLLLTELTDTAWSVGALFFGLWLIPMGWLVLRSGWMPPFLGWTLIVGGVGYVLSSAVEQLLPEATTVVELLTMPASIGEFLMIIYLFRRGTAGPLTTPGLATA